MTVETLGFDREEAIDQMCMEAQIEAQASGEPGRIWVCAGPPWCAGSKDHAPCAWCTLVTVSPDGSRARSEPRHA